MLLTRITMPYLLCMSLVALLSGVLNSRRQVRRELRRLDRPQPHHDGGDARCPGLGLRNDPLAGIIQAWGVFAAGLLQLWLLVDGVRRNGLLAQAPVAAHDATTCAA